MSRLLDVEERVSPGVWDEIISAARGSTIYHTRAWGTVCEQAFPLCTAASRLYRFDDNEVLLPGTVTPALRGRSSMFHSVRPSDYGGVVAEKPVTALHLAAIARDLRRRGFVRVVMYGNPFSPPTGGVPGFRCTSEWTQAVPLDGGFEHVWMERFCKNTRRSVRKAEKGGVEVAEGDGRDVDTLYRLYLMSADRWGDSLTWLRPKELCEAAYRAGRSRLWVARVDGRIIGASMDYYHGDMCFAGWRAFDVEHESTKVNYALVSNSVRTACDEGCRYYDMGASAGLKGVEEFKERFGAVPLPYGRWSWEHPAYRAVSTSRKGITRARSALHLVADR